MSVMNFDMRESYSASMRDLLNELAHNTNVLKRYNKIIGKHLNQFVPMKSGNLRASMTVDAEGVHWGEGIPYAHYQYMGEVYGPNFPVRNEDGTIIGWCSPAGMQKYPTGRPLGTPGEIDGWVFGYTTPGTMAFWDAPYTGHQWVQFGAGSPAIKADINLEIYREVVRPICKKRGKK